MVRSLFTILSGQVAFSADSWSDAHITMNRWIQSST